MRLLLIPLLLTASIGCNLATDLDAYPYQGSIIIDPDDESPDIVVDMPTIELPVADMPEDLPVTPDLPPDLPQGEPRLRITEIVIDSSGDGSTETGEYIEIYNAGTAAADPRAIEVKLLETMMNIAIDVRADSTEEQEVLDALRPILPGEHFVFLLQSSPRFEITQALSPGTFYEYGRWSDSPTTAFRNSGRTVEVIYYEPLSMRAIPQDRLTWAGSKLVEVDATSATADALPIEEDFALSLDPQWYNEPTPSLVAQWCYDPGRVAGTAGLRGSPGAPMPGAACARDVFDLP
jgi:hypothetical protein